MLSGYACFLSLVAGAATKWIKVALISISSPHSPRKMVYFKYPHTEGLPRALTHKLIFMKRFFCLFYLVINVIILIFTRRKILVIFLSNEL